MKRREIYEMIAAHSGGDECLLWSGQVDRRGCGKSGSVMVHILAYRHVFGAVPDGHYVRRSCGNGLCFAPWHLVLLGRHARRPASWRKAGSRTIKPRPIKIVGDIGYVPLTHGKVALIDAADVELVGQYNWYADRAHGGGWRAKRTRSVKEVGLGDSRDQSLHQLLSEGLPWSLSDHRDGDGLNNRRANLRECTTVQNAQNRRAFNKQGLPKGVFRSGGGFRAKIQADGVIYQLGKFETAERAAIEYDLAAMRLHGEFARLNQAMGFY